MKNSILLFFLALLLYGCEGQSQCSITSIQFGEVNNCDPNTGKYLIPVTVTYQNQADSARLSATGLTYEFGKKHLLNNHHTTNGQNQFTFGVYDYADGAINNIWVYVELLGGNCTASVIDSANYTISYTECPINTEGGGGDNPIPYICFADLTLSGTVTQDTGYFASNSIVSTQVFEAGATDTLGATTFVRLLPGFHAKAGATVLINNNGCAPQNGGNGGGNGLVGLDCPKVLYLSSAVSNNREYSADSLIITNQNLFPTANVIYNAPYIEYGANYNLQTGATVQWNKATSCN